MDRIQFMKENGIAAFAEADRETGVIRIEKIGSLEYWSLFQELVLYSDAAQLYESTGNSFPFRIWRQGDTGCLVSQITENLAAALFYETKLDAKAQIDWVEELDKKIRMLYGAVN